ncbi:hypothetical protein ACO0RG_001838 [Hanseniaspora osmophila]|uniref:RNA polymerase I-specific transcription initiation factor RRN3 n=1 Tax=Hanseniaspora osmophila TaxID=56408 RepID=A0A1E5RHP0_9ASCO|nr:RNA polymerase I-specific transcription initiation factor RRN3 [Hanseniaspora osmophila]
MLASKRAHADNEGSSNGSASKKIKKNVTFDLPSGNQIKEKSGTNPANAAKIHYKYMQSAIDEADQHNDSTAIENLILQIEHHDSHKDKIKPKTFEILLSVLSNNISKVENNSKFNSLVISIINYNKWYKIPSETCVYEYMTFLKILCSSLPKWLAEVLGMLISQLSEVPIKESTYRHHVLMQYFVKVFPTSVNLFTANLSKNFPNKNDTKTRNVNYIENLLKITEYCPEFKFPIWSLIVEKAISIDVELQNELDDLDDDIDALDSDEDDDDDDEDDDDEEDDDENDGEDVDADARDNDAEDGGEEAFMDGDEEYQVELSTNIADLSGKLDYILSVISKNLAHLLDDENLEQGDGINVFNTLMSLFKTHILPTYYTKSIQYLMFHAAQQQPELMDAFLVTLIDISFSPNESMENKIKSLQYVGSFIARAKKLSKSQIMFVSSYLTSWLNRYVIEREIEVDLLPGGMERFKHFYAAFQALCYIFCFRHHYFKVDFTEGKDFAESQSTNDKKSKQANNEESLWECDIDKFFQRMVISKFNPLKFCNENVMLMFAKITQTENLVYCYSIIEKNNSDRLRGIVSANAKGSRNGASLNQSRTVAPIPLADRESGNKGFSLVARQQFIDLQSYFPYDPLFLKKYKRLMHDFYIEWSEVSGDYETDESEEDDDNM